jgi:hypothetical protein
MVTGVIMAVTGGRVGEKKKEMDWYGSDRKRRRRRRKRRSQRL